MVRGQGSVFNVLRALRVSPARFAREAVASPGPLVFPGWFPISGGATGGAKVGQVQMGTSFTASVGVSRFRAR